MLSRAPPWAGSTMAAYTAGGHPMPHDFTQPDQMNHDVSYGESNSFVNNQTTPMCSTRGSSPDPYGSWKSSPIKCRDMWSAKSRMTRFVIIHRRPAGLSLMPLHKQSSSQRHETKNYSGMSLIVHRSAIVIGGQQKPTPFQLLEEFDI